MRFRAILFLILYNIFFIIPLIFVFIFAYMGAGSQKLNKIYEKMGASVKIITGIFFLFISFLLVILTL